MRRTIAEIQDFGIEVDIWKIEGVDERSDCEMLVEQARSGGRDGVVCVVLGRGADDAKVDQWLQPAAPVDGFVGFAIGRSIWWDPLKAYVDGKIERPEGARRIAENYLRFVSVYERPTARLPSRPRRRRREDATEPGRLGAGLRQGDHRWTASAVTRCGAPPSSARCKREVERRHKRGTMRFLLLVLTLILTAIVVTVVMFRTLYLLLG